MFSPDDYELLDFGHGRKLERLGARILDRPAPASENAEPANPAIWTTADLKFQRRSGSKGDWLAKHSSAKKQIGETWTISHDPVTFELKCSDSGAVGVYPEQAENWTWLAKQIRRAKRPLKVLNLFAYTGGSTLAAAAAGAHVTHVDAAKGVVSWARRCARLSNLNDAPIRWIAEDAVRFVQRELKRGSDYDGVILDPPTYGHGPNRETWQIEKGLRPLLKLCGQLTSDHRAFILLTCHSTTWGPPDLESLLADSVFGHCQSKTRAKRLTIRTADSRTLHSGVVARWPN